MKLDLVSCVFELGNWSECCSVPESGVSGPTVLVLLVVLCVCSTCSMRPSPLRAFVALPAGLAAAVTDLLDKES